MVAGRTRESRVDLYVGPLHRHRGGVVVANDQGPRLEQRLRLGFPRRGQRAPCPARDLFRGRPGPVLRMRVLRFKRDRGLVFGLAWELRGRVFRFLHRFRRRRERHGPQARAQRLEKHLLAPGPSRGHRARIETLRAHFRPRLAENLAGDGAGPLRGIPGQLEGREELDAGRRHSLRRRYPADPPGKKTEADPPHTVPGIGRGEIGLLLPVVEVA
mmetsp:Transcript_26942/g.78181  ORF Transcript_26942/g.78181 Transcript_26942/m.78181 type:complete len:215 (-) Transcript_26942:2962-3606(-)